MSVEAKSIMKKAAKAAESMKAGSIQATRIIRDIVKNEVGKSKYVGRGFFFTIPALIAGATALSKAAAIGGASAAGGIAAKKVLTGRGMYTGRSMKYSGRGLYTRDSRRKAYKSMKAAGGAVGRFLYRGAKRVGRISKAAAIEAAKEYVQREGAAALMDTLGRAYEAYN